MKDGVVKRSCIIILKIPFETTECTEADFVSINVELNLAAVPSLRPYFYGGVPHDNVTQHKSTNDAVLNVEPLRRKVHEIVTLLNGCRLSGPPCPRLHN